MSFLSQKASLLCYVGISLFFFLPGIAPATTTTLGCQVLVVGGGAGGICAAIQSARLGAQTILVEETPWFGGMLTAAGVSATDGNHLLPTGLWGEFRQHLYDYYGGPGAVNTGWVSMTLFEPHIGNMIFHQMADDVATSLTYFHGYWSIRALKEDNRIIGGVFKNDNDDFLVVFADVIIAADECGDFLALSGAPYRIGMEAQSETGEPGASPVATDIIQDITYVATLKDYGVGNDHTIPEPPNYDPSNYRCTCQEVCDDSARYTCEQMFNYGRLPNNKFMINWPIHGNDYYLNVLEMSHEERKIALQEAKNFTLGWIYFMQTEGGYSHYGIADDEYPTSDGLPFIPYHRESRRLKGVVQFRVQDILDPYNTPSGDLYKTGIAVGDYPIDHHHTKAPIPVQESFPRIPSFAVPYGALIPEEIDGLIVAEKSISVTHMVNGCTRLQPCVMAIGQAAGAAAAIAVKDSVQPRNISIRKLQQTLLDAGCWCLPFVDVSPDRWSFQAVQRIGLTGALKGTGIPSGWANKTYFYPEAVVERYTAGEALAISLDQQQPPSTSVDLNSTYPITRADAVLAVYEVIGSPAPINTSPYFNDVPTTSSEFSAIQYAYEQGWLIPWAEPPFFQPALAITREEFAALLDRALDPFNNIPVQIKPPPRPGSYVYVLKPLWKIHTDPTVPDITAPAPEWFPSATDNNRSMAYNPTTNHLLITDNANNTIHIVDADTGTPLGTLDNSILSGGVLPVASVVVDANGVIYAAPYNADPFKVYRWENETSQPHLAFSATLFYEGEYYYGGRAMAITGTGVNTRLYISATGDTGRFFILSTQDGHNFSIEEWVSGGDTGSPYGLYGLTALSETCVLAKGKSGNLLRYIKDNGIWRWDDMFTPSKFNSSITSALGVWQENNLLFALAYDPFVSVDENGKVVSTTGGLVYKMEADDTLNPIAVAPLEESYISGNGAGAVAYDPQRRRLFVEFSRNGYAAYNLAPLLPFKGNLWIMY